MSDDLSARRSEENAAKLEQQILRQSADYAELQLVCTSVVLAILIISIAVCICIRGTWV